MVALLPSEVGPGEQLEVVACRVEEVHALAAVLAVGLTWPLLLRVRPVLHVEVAYPRVGPCEVIVVRDEREVNRREVDAGVGELQGNEPAESCRREVREPDRLGPPGW